ncbi:HEAT repeat domain-containing protein [Thermogemmatispora carboxidivorans]|uniref:HEAT repeat domain-containing protein n=1 Tax=Thermogemmatispora carboxidivorans TaxID=1382306 RepID=UPI00069A2502|nr:HEAT repeat domain-containing protein [Thermogemmatispora carboxidivorans]
MLWWKEFPQGLIFGEEGFFTEPGYLPRQYPYYVARAFLSVQYDDEPREDEEVYDWYRVAWEAAEAFVERWGGVDEETLRRVLREGEGRDRLAAAFALGHSPFEGVNETLAPLLEHPDWLLRCAAACCLALRRDERAIPVIERYLLTPEPTMVNRKGLICPVPEADCWYEYYKGLVAWVLAEWGPESVGPVLRQALLQLWKEEENAEGLPGPVSLDVYEALSYALGRRGVLGALHGVRMPGPLRRQMLRWLALGYRQIPERFNSNDVFALLKQKEVREELREVLWERFGLGGEEIEEALDSYRCLEDIEKITYWWAYRENPEKEGFPFEGDEETERLAAELWRAKIEKQKQGSQPSAGDERQAEEAR